MKPYVFQTSLWERKKERPKYLSSDETTKHLNPIQIRRKRNPCYTTGTQDVRKCKSSQWQKMTHRLNRWDTTHSPTDKSDHVSKHCLSLQSLIPTCQWKCPNYQGDNWNAASHCPSPCFSSINASHARHSNSNQQPEQKKKPCRIDQKISLSTLSRNKRVLIPGPY